MNFHSLADTYKLNNGVKIPIVGFGTWQTPDGAVAKSSVLAAINAGYRLIDTAAAYGNEESVGEGIKQVVLTATTCLCQPNYGIQITVTIRLRRQLILACKNLA